MSRNYDDREEKSFLERNSTWQNQKIYKENVSFLNYTKNVVNETWLLLWLVECVQPQTQCSQYGNCRLNEPELCSVLVYTSGMRGQRWRVRVAIGLGVGVSELCAPRSLETWYIPRPQYMTTASAATAFPTTTTILMLHDRRILLHLSTTLISPKSVTCAYN